MVIATCPECFQEVQVSGHPQIGHHALCEACGIDLEVVWLYPLALDYLEEVNQSGDSTQTSRSSPIELKNV